MSLRKTLTRTVATAAASAALVVGDAENTMGSIVSDGPALISSGMNFL